MKGLPLSGKAELLKRLGAQPLWDAGRRWHAPGWPDQRSTLLPHGVKGSRATLSSPAALPLHPGFQTQRPHALGTLTGLGLQPTRLRSQTLRCQHTSMHPCPCGSENTYTHERALKTSWAGVPMSSHHTRCASVCEIVWFCMSLYFLHQNERFYRCQIPRCPISPS